MRRATGTIVLVAVVFLCSSCSTTTVRSEPEPAPTTSRTAPESKEAVSPSLTPTPAANDVADEQSLREAESVAEAVMREFVAHDRDYDQWWAGVSPYLDPVALSDYAYTDPRTVPASQVTGAGLISAAPSSTQVTVLVPTDAGQYRVELFRQAIGATWLVNSMTPLVTE